MDPSCYRRPTLGLCPILLLWLSAVFLFLCSPSHAAEAPGAAPRLPSPARPVGRCSPEQASALLRLFGSEYNITGSLPSWRPGTDCCAWQGITCEGTTGAVVVLDLGERLFSAHVNASSLLALPHLSSINLSDWIDVDFSSTSFPSLLAGLPNLTHLTITTQGELPVDFPRTSKLASLQLTPGSPTYDLKLVNGDLGTLVGNLPSLRELRLDTANLSDGGNRWCRALSSVPSGLQVLSLRACSLSGPISSCLSRLSSLREIYLDNNNFSSSGLPNFDSNFSSLRTLSMSGCGLTGRLPGNLLWLPKLEVLDLSSNPLTGSIPEFSPNSVLQILRLTSTHLSGELPASMGHLKSLKELNLKGCNLTGQMPDSIGDLSRLTSLVLASNSFTGRIPPGVVGFTLLTELDLSDNSFSGQIPVGLLSSCPKLDRVVLQNNRLSGLIPSPRPKKLLNLSTLNLQNNALDGSIPSSLFSLPSLRSLLLNKNRLSGRLRVPLNVSASSLQEIDLSGNELEGEIPGSIFHLPGLTNLNLSFNRFNGTLELAVLQNATMSSLDLSYNLLSVVSKPSDANATTFPLLETLNLASCNLSRYPDYLRGEHQSVFNLDLSNNRLQGKIPTWVWRKLDGLRVSLNLSHNLLEGFEELSSRIPNSNDFILDLHSNLLRGPLVYPPGAVFLDYSDNRFTSGLSEDIGSLLNRDLTTFISLSGNNLSGEVPPSICNLTRLTDLDLSNNRFSGLIPSCLVNASLSVLNLRGNRFEGDVPRDFGGQCSLSTLDLSENQLQGQLPRSLANCGELEILNLRQNHLVDTFPSWLGNLPSLRVLVLQSNGFHGRLRCDGSPGDKFASIQILDVSSNSFVGELPSDCFDHFKEMMVSKKKLGILSHGSFGQVGYYQDSLKITVKGRQLEITKILNILVTVDLSSNRLQGEIPSSMGKLKNLVLLNISHNNHGGAIPPTLGQLASLESLDMSTNMLSGGIPEELTRLTFLSILNLSYNQLSGSIPRAGQLSLFPNSSFLGNPGLCGPPLSRRCAGDNGGKAPPRPAPSGGGIDWGSKWIAFALGAGVGASWSPIVLWWRGFFEPQGGRRRR